MNTTLESAPETSPGVKINRGAKITDFFKRVDSNPPVSASNDIQPADSLIGEAVNVVEKKKRGRKPKNASLSETKPPGTA